MTLKRDLLTYSRSHKGAIAEVTKALVDALSAALSKGGPRGW